jgi:prepilin-type N-terminal cleavage/methylation domain-containing protein
MKLTLPYLQHIRTRSYLAGIFPGSSRGLMSGICRARVRRIPRGFTLIELAVAIAVIALLLGSILIPLTTQVQQKQISDTQKTLEDIKEALVGHAITFGYLPCPDTNNDGLEDWNSSGNGRCTTTVSGGAYGNLPWQTLGVASADVWGNRFRYAINERYARHAAAERFSLSTPGSGTDVRVCLLSSNCAGTALTSTAVAAVLSYGKNGYGATSSITGSSNPAPTSADEIMNTTNNRDVVSRTITAPNSPSGEFDDIVAWLPLYTLFNRMVSAGKLP